MPKINSAPNPDEIVQYLVVNQDLPMSAGKLAAQAAHAATLATIAGLAATGDAKKWFDQWLTPSASYMKKIVLAAPASTLESLSAKGGYLVIDAGHTEIPPGSLTVVALPPKPRSVAAVLVAGLTLYKSAPPPAKLSQAPIVPIVPVVPTIS